MKHGRALRSFTACRALLPVFLLAGLAGVGRAAAAQPVVADGTWRAIPGSARALSPPVGIFIPADKDSQYANAIGVVIRGADDRVYYQTFSLALERWTGSWRPLPVRTSAAPFTFVGAAWDIVVKDPGSGNKLHAINWQRGWTEWVDEGAGALPWGTPAVTEDDQGRRWSFRRGRRDRVEYRCEPPPESASRPALELQTGHHGGVECVAFSPDGKTLASGGAGNKIILWDVASGAKIRVLRSAKPHMRLRSLAWFPDGTRLAGGGDDGTVRFWDADTGALQQVLNTPSWAIALSPDGKTLAAGGGDVVKLWDVTTGAELRELTGHPGVTGVAFSGDGRTLAVGSAGPELKTWDVAAGTVKWSVTPRNSRPDQISSVAFAPDGGTIATGSGIKYGRGEVYLWDAQTGELKRTLSGHDTHVVSVAFSLAATMLASAGGNDQTVRLWDAATGTLLSTLHDSRDPTPPFAVAFSRDGQTVASGHAWGAVKLWNARTGTLQRTLGWNEIVGPVAVSPDDRTIASGSFKTGIRLWDARTGTLKRTLHGHNDIHHLVFTPDGRILASAGGDGTVKLWDMKTGAALRTFKGNPGWGWVVFSPDGKTLSRRSHGEELTLWDVRTGAKLRTLPGRNDFPGVPALAFSPDGKTAATCLAPPHASDHESVPTEIWLWDARTWRLQRKLEGHVGAVAAFFFSPDGRTLATGNVQGLRLWDVQTGKLHQAMLPGVWEPAALSPDGKILVRSGHGHAIGLWDVATRTPLRELTGHTGPPLSVSFTSDGKKLISSGGDHTIRIWETNTGRLLATLVVLPPAQQDQAPTDWLLITPEGYYDGSPGAARFIQWRVGEDLFPVEAYEEAFHRPDLVRKAMAGQAVPVPPALRRFADGRSVPPLVTFTFPRHRQEITGDSLQVELVVTDDGDVTRVELFANGRPVAVKLRVGDTKPIRQGGKPIRIGGKPVPSPHRLQREFIATVPLPPGETQVTLKAVAHDAEALQGWSEIALFRRGVAPVMGTLHVLSVGVSRYRDKSLNLKYAAADAAAFAGLWDRMKGGLYDDVLCTQLTDGQATTERVQAEFSRLISVARPQDSIALFLSGHGVQAGAGQFYFATHEVDADSPRRLEQTALPWTVFETTLAKVAAKRVLLFLDACHSGSVLGEQSATNERLAEALARRGGVLVFTSSRGSELSYEDDTLRQGAFTAALVEGIGEGKADLAVGGEPDGKITTAELLAYLQARVPQMTGNRQTPTAPLLSDFGEAFLLAQRE